MSFLSELGNNYNNWGNYIPPDYMRSPSDNTSTSQTSTGEDCKDMGAMDELNTPGLEISSPPNLHALPWFNHAFRALIDKVETANIIASLSTSPAPVYINMNISMNFPNIFIDSNEGANQSQSPALEKKRKRVRKETDKSLICFVCFNKKTQQMWRSGPYGKKTLCNGCGLKYSKERFRLIQKWIKHIPLQFYAKPKGVKRSPTSLKDIKNYFDEKKFQELEALTEKYISIMRSSENPNALIVGSDLITAYIRRAKKLCSVEEAEQTSSRIGEGTRCARLIIGEYTGATQDGKIEALPEGLASDAAAIEAYVKCFTLYSNRDRCPTEEKIEHYKRQLKSKTPETSKEPQTKRQKIDGSDIVSPIDEISLMPEEQIDLTDEPQAIRKRFRFYFKFNGDSLPIVQNP